MSTDADTTIISARYDDPADKSDWLAEPGGEEYVTWVDPAIQGYNALDFEPMGAAAFGAVMMHYNPYKDAPSSIQLYYGDSPQALLKGASLQVGDDDSDQLVGMWVRVAADEFQWINFGFGYDRFEAVKAFYGVPSEDPRVGIATARG